MTPLCPLALIAASRDGARLAARLGQAWPAAERHVLSRFLSDGGRGACEVSGPLRAAVQPLFGRCRGLVFFLPVGAVVRLIAPCLRDKRSDPAVVAVDDGGRFAVCVLSGHAGGGNALAEQVAAVLGASPVLTTAVERRGLPAPELIGEPFGWTLEATRTALLRAAAALANGAPLGLYQDAGQRGWLPRDAPVRRFRSLERLAAADLEAAVVITDRCLPVPLAERVVVWRPRGLVAGLGCSGGAAADELAALLAAALDAAGLARAGLGLLATVDRKLAEPGLQRLAARLGLELRGFPPEALAPIAVPNPSDVVQRAVGTPSVAEAAAILASNGGELVAAKRTSPHATVAIARRRSP